MRPHNVFDPNSFFTAAARSEKKYSMHTDSDTIRIDADVFEFFCQWKLGIQAHHETIDTVQQFTAEPIIRRK